MLEGISVIYAEKREIWIKFVSIRKKGSETVFCLASLDKHVCFVTTTTEITANEDPVKADLPVPKPNNNGYLISFHTNTWILFR